MDSCAASAASQPGRRSWSCCSEAAWCSGSKRVRRTIASLTSWAQAPYIALSPARGAISTRRRRSVVAPSMTVSTAWCRCTSRCSTSARAASPAQAATAESTTPATGMPMCRAMPSSSPAWCRRIDPGSAKTASSPAAATARHTSARCACARSACDSALPAPPTTIPARGPTRTGRPRAPAAAAAPPPPLRRPRGPPAPAARRPGSPRRARRRARRPARRPRPRCRWLPSQRTCRFRSRRLSR